MDNQELFLAISGRLQQKAKKQRRHDHPGPLCLGPCTLNFSFCVFFSTTAWHRYFCDDTIGSSQTKKRELPSHDVSSHNFSNAANSRIDKSGGVAAEEKAHRPGNGGSPGGGRQVDGFVVMLTHW